MSVIPYSELFDFEGFDKAIKEAMQSTIALGSALGKIAEVANGNLASALDKISDKKIQIVDAKSIEDLKKLNDEIDKNAVSADKARAASKGAGDANKAAAGSMDELIANLKQTKKEYEALSEADRNNLGIGGKLLKQAADETAALKTLKSEYDKTTKAVNAAEGSYAQMSSKLAGLRNELKNMPNAFDASTGAINTSNKAAVAILEQIEMLDNAVKAADGTMGQFGRNVGNYASGTASLKQELKELAASMAQAKMRGEEDSEAFREMAARAGEIKDTLSDVAAEIKRVGSDTAAIEGIVGIFESVAGMSAVAEGSMQMFGVQSDAVGESIKRLQSIQTIMMGIQSVANTIQKESAAVLFIVNAQQKLHILSTRLQTAAESESIIVRKSAAAAQWLLNAAMNANPVGILIVAAAALAGIVLYLSSNTKKAAEEQIKLNEAQKEFLEYEKEAIAIVTKRNEVAIAETENTIKQAQAQGKSKAELSALEEKLLQQKLDLSTKKRGIAETDLKTDAYFNDQAIDSLAKLTDAYKQSLKDLEYQKQAKALKLPGFDEKDLEAAQSSFDLIKAKYEQLTEAYSNEDAAINAIDEHRAKRKKELADQELKDSLSLAESAVITAKEGSEQEYRAKKAAILAKQKIEEDSIAKSRLDNEKVNADTIKLHAETNKQLQDLDKQYYLSQMQSAKATIDAHLVLAIEGSQAELNLKIESLNKQYDIDMKMAENNASQKELLTATHQKAIEDLNREFNIKQTENSLNSEIALANAKLMLAQSGSDAEYTAKRELVDKQYELEKAGIENSINDETLKAAKLVEIWEKNQKDKQQIEKEQTGGQINSVHDKRSNELENQILDNKDILANHKSTVAQKYEASKNISDLSNQLIDNEALRIEKLHNNGLMSEKEYADAVLNIRKEKTDKELALEEQKSAKIKEIESRGIQLVSEGLTALNDISKEKSDEKIAGYETERDAKLAAIDAASARDIEAAGNDEKQKSLIEKRTAREKAQTEAEYAKKILAEKRKQAQADKDTALYNVALNTAAGVMSVLSTGGGTHYADFGIMAGILTAMVIAQGLMQAAVINAKPLPKMMKGTDNAPEGFAMVNDQPGDTFREIIISRGKMMMPAKRNQIVHLNRGDKVIPAFDSKRMLQNAEVRQIMEQQSLNDSLAVKLESGRKLEVQYNMAAALSGMKIDEDYLIEGIGRKLYGLPIEQHIHDENGYRRSVRRGNMTVTYLNSRNTLA